MILIRDLSLHRNIGTSCPDQFFKSESPIGFCYSSWIVIPLAKLSFFLSWFLSSSFLHHLPDRKPWKPWAVLQLSHVLVHHFWAVPHYHWWPCKLRCGSALYVQCGVLCFCHHCHPSYAQLVDCHDGWHPLESSPRAGWALESPGNLVKVGIPTLFQIAARSLSAFLVHPVFLDLCSLCMESLVKENRSCIELNWIWSWKITLLCNWELNYNYRDWMRGNRTLDDDYSKTRNIFWSIKEVGLTVLVKKQRNSTSSIANQQEIHFLCFSVKKQSDKWLNVVMWPQVLMTIKMGIDTVLFSILQLIISMRYKRKEMEQCFKTSITSSKHVTVRPKLVIAWFEMAYSLCNYFFP